VNLWRWVLRRGSRLAAALRDERAHNRHLARTNEKLTSQNDTLRLKLIDLGVNPNEVERPNDPDK
jgi:hypothetical protein